MVQCLQVRAVDATCTRLRRGTDFITACIARQLVDGNPKGACHQVGAVTDTIAIAVNATDEEPSPSVKVEHKIRVLASKWRDKAAAGRQSTVKFQITDANARPLYRASDTTQRHNMRRAVRRVDLRATPPKVATFEAAPPSKCFGALRRSNSRRRSH